MAGPADPNELIKNVYYSPEGYTGAKKLWETIQDKYPHSNITLKQVQDWHRSQLVVQQNKPVKPIKEFEHYDVVKIPNHLHMTDLLTMATENRGRYQYRWMIVVIDVASRYIGTVALHTKNGAYVTEALKQIYNEDDHLDVPKIIQTDLGSEFTNRSFEAFCTEQHITHKTVEVGDHRGVGLVERVNKTIAMPLYAFMQVLENKNAEEGRPKVVTSWVDNMKSFVTAYNNRINNAHGLKPIDAIKLPSVPHKDRKAIKDPFLADKDETLTDAERAELKAKIFHFGDNVRLLLKRPPKGSYQDNRIRATDQRWSNEIYTIYATRKRSEDSPRVYLLLNADGSLKPHAAYPEELQLIKSAA